MANRIKLSEAIKQHFIMVAKQKPVGKDGRVYVGNKRYLGKDLIRYFGNPLYNSDHSVHGLNYGSGGYNYYIPRARWIKLFGAENYPMKTAAKKVVKKKVAAKKVATNKDVRVPVTRTLAQAHAAAKESANQRVILSDGKISMLNDEIYTSFCIQDITNELGGLTKGRYLPFDVSAIQNIFAAGLPVIWTYGDSSVGYRFVGFNGEFGEFKLAPKPIVINGYTGKAMGSYWNFGCANISVEDLLHARNFLRDAENIASKNNKVNRTIKSVYIGDGCFTLDVLERMNLD